MGSVISAKAADERAEQKQTVRREKRDERRKRRFLKQQSQRYSNVKYDDSGALFYVNENDEKIFIDEYGHEYYLDESDEPYYLDEKGERFYMDENREPYYLEEDGTKYFLDISGRKYYFDEYGEPYITATIDANVDGNGDDREDIVKLNDEDLKLRSPATSASSSCKSKEPSGSRQTTGTRQTTGSRDTAETRFSLSRRNYSAGESDTQSYRMRSERTGKPSVEIIDHRDRPTSTIKSEESSNLDDTLSSYSTLSFMRSEYDMVIPRTPDYINDTSKESETQVTAQIEAENKILKKLLKQDKERSRLPAGKLFRKVGTFNVKLESDTKDCIIVDSLFLSNGNTILADGSNFKFKQFNENLEYLNSVDIEERPYGVCGGKDDIIHATFQSRVYSGIKVLKVMVNLISVTKTIRLTSGTPYGIARSHQGLAVVMSTKEGWQIHLMTLQGNISRSLKLDTEDMKPLMSPHYITVTNKLKIIVSDRGTNSVYIFDTNGKMLAVYNELREPLGISSDNQGSVFVVSPGVMHQISETGERIQALMRRETTGFAPLCICYDPEDHLLVLAGKSNMVTAYEMSN